MDDYVIVSIEKKTVNEMREWIKEYERRDPSLMSDIEVVHHYIWMTLHEGG
jgi:hypothetical protein